jgi:hypothetical protein
MGLGFGVLGLGQEARMQGESIVNLLAIAERKKERKKDYTGSACVG